MTQGKHECQFLIVVGLGMRAKHNVASRVRDLKLDLEAIQHRANVRTFSICRLSCNELRVGEKKSFAGRRSCTRFCTNKPSKVSILSIERIVKSTSYVSSSAST